jgi:hypothetical protein
VLVQREMEGGRSPLVSIARVSAGRGATDRIGDLHEQAGAETATGFKKEIGGHNSASGSSGTDIVALRLGGGLGLTAEAHARSEGQLARKNRILNPGCEAHFNFRGVRNPGSDPTACTPNECQV